MQCHSLNQFIVSSPGKKSLYLLADSDHMKLRQSMLLLQFLENLEKQMYNAFEGSAVSLPQSMRVSISF